MKQISQMSVLVVAMAGFFSVTSYGQQKPSERSFRSVMNEVRQKQADRTKMLQQVKQTTSSNTVSQNTVLPSGTNTQDKAAPVDRANAPVNNRPVVRPKYLPLKKQ
jgi:hypothetical protein